MQYTRIMSSPITPSGMEQFAIEAAMNPYSTLDAAGNRMWEQSYNNNLADGEEPKGAAIHAWMHIKKFYRKSASGKWVRKPGKRDTMKRVKNKNKVTLRSVMSRALR